MDPITQFILNEAASFEAVKAELIKKYGFTPDNDMIQQIIDTRNSLEKLDKAVQGFGKVVDDLTSMDPEIVTRKIEIIINKSNEPSLMAPIAITAAVLAGSYGIYKRFFSQAARSCKGKSGDAKTLCILQYKKKALNNQIKHIQKVKPLCKKSKDKNKCEKKINNKLRKIKNKLRKL